MPDDDLIARLDRARQQLDQSNVPGLLEDAAREIRRLRAENDRLQAAVLPMNLGWVEPPHLGRNA